MWSFLNNVRESVRQVVAPPPSAASAASSTITTTPTTTNTREVGFEEALDQLTTGLLCLWRKVDQTATKVLHQAFNGDVSLREETLSRLFQMPEKARASLSQDELLELLIDAISQATDRTQQALDEANFLLSLGIEEQIAHTKDYVGCYEWWDRTVNRRLLVCQDLLQTRFTDTSSTPAQMETVMALSAQMSAIRHISTQPMAAIAARGRLLEDERYDLIKSLPPIFPIGEGVQSAHMGSTAPDSAVSTTTQSSAISPSRPSCIPSVEGVASDVPHNSYIPQFTPFAPSPTPADAAPLNSSATATLEHSGCAPCTTQYPSAKPLRSQELSSDDEQASLELLARQAAVEQERLAREAAAEQERLAEQLRLEEQERLAE
ncbi:membrane associated protein-like protein, partial [Leishmania tarentolae]